MRTVTRDSQWGRWFRLASCFALLVAVALAWKQPLEAQGPRRIQVRRWRVEGVHVLDNETIRGVLDPYAGKMMTLAQIKAVARKLGEQYEKRGYVMAYPFIPPQSFKDGVVLIKVQEGKWGKVRVDGNHNYSDEIIRYFFEPALAAGVVFKPALQKQLLLLNQFMDLRVQSVLEARKDGSVDVILKAKDVRPLHGLVDYDNFGVRLVGRNRVGVGAVAGNAVADGDNLTLKYVVPIDAGASDPFAFVNYSVPVLNHGWKVEGSYAHARTSVGQELAVLGIEGDADIFSLRLVIPDTISLTTNTAWTAEAVAKQVVNTGLDRSLLISEDDVRAFAIGHRGTSFSASGKTQFAHTVTLYAGTGAALGGSEKGDVGTSRAAAGADNLFTKLAADAVVIHKLTNKTFLLGRFSGQTADDALMTPELFAIGGPDNVRGFEQGEFLGDYGYALAAEIRQTLLQSELSQLQVLAFIDHGDAEIYRPLVGERNTLTLTGAGVGMRAQLGRKISARADCGFPVDPKTNAEGKSAKLHAQVSCRF